MKTIDLNEKYALINAQWTPHVVAELNGQQVKLAKIEGEFVWHAHDDEDVSDDDMDEPPADSMCTVLDVCVVCTQVLQKKSWNGTFLLRPFRLSSRSSLTYQHILVWLMIYYT